MKVRISEPARGWTDCEIRLGASSWDDDDTSVKFAWKNSDGHWARGGEVPAAALPQMLELAIRDGAVSLSSA